MGGERGDGGLAGGSSHFLVGARLRACREALRSSCPRSRLRFCKPLLNLGKEGHQPRQRDPTAPSCAGCQRLRSHRPSPPMVWWGGWFVPGFGPLNS